MRFLVFELGEVRDDEVGGVALDDEIGVKATIGCGVENGSQQLSEWEVEWG